MTPFIQHHNHDFFKAACQNVKSTKAAYNLLHNEINKLITKKPLNNGSLDFEILSKIKLLTKLAIPVYTAYSEAIFLKLIYTPCGFTKQEIDQIFTIQKRQSIIQAWKEALIISTRKSIGKKSNFLPNSRKKIEQIINRYLQEPSELRNKIAHGQWVCTFNKHNNALTHETSVKIEKITIVDIDIWISAFTTLGELLFLANQSPLKGYSEQYWNKITKIEQELEKKMFLELRSKSPTNARQACKERSIHSLKCLPKSSLSQLYGYSSNGDGIRHVMLLDKPNLYRCEIYARRMYQFHQLFDRKN